MTEEELFTLSAAYHNGKVTDSCQKFTTAVLGMKEDFEGMDQLLKDATNPDVPMAFHYILMLATSQKRAKLPSREAYTTWFTNMSNALE